MAEKGNLKLRIYATDPDGTIPALTVIGTPPYAAFADSGNGSGSFVFTPDSTQIGVHHVTFIASDDSLADSEVVAITVTRVNRSPALDSIGPKSVLEGIGLRFRIHATDPDGAIPTLTALNIPTNGTFADSGNGCASFMFDPDSSQIGSHEVTFIASDGSLADSEVVSIAVTARRTTTTWQLAFGETGNDGAIGVAPVGETGWIVGARSSSVNSIDFLRVDTWGNKIWEHSVLEHGWWVKMAAAPDGGFVLCGSTLDDRTPPKSLARLLKIDSSGKSMWSSTYYTPSDDDNAAYSICTAPDGGLVFVGWGMGGGMIARMTKTAASGGGGAWVREFRRTWPSWASDVVPVGNDGYAVTGAAATDSEGWDVYLIRTDAAGELMWERTFGGGRDDEATALVASPDGGFVVAGNTMSFGAGAADIYVVRVDPSGTKVWERTFGGSASDVACGITPSADGGYVIAGSTQSFGAGEWDIYLIKMDAEGNKIWDRTFGGSKDDKAASVISAGDGGYVIAGTTSSFGAGGTDIYLIKTDALGLVEASSTSK